MFGERSSTDIERNAVISVGKAYNASTTVPKIGLSMSWAIPDGAKLIEAGFYYGFGPDKREIIIDNAARSFKTTLTGTEGSYVSNLNVTGHLDDNICFAAYIKYEQDGKEYLVINGEEDSIGGYVVDAAELPKTLSGTDDLIIVNYKGRSWTLPEVE